MKKKLVSLLLAGIMMFSTCTSAYAAEQVLSGLKCSFAASTTAVHTTSTTSIMYAHVHYYTLNIIASNSDGSVERSVIGTYKYDTWDDEFITTVVPSEYAVGNYVGKSFKGRQECEVSIPETDELEECYRTVY